MLCIKLNLLRNNSYVQYVRRYACFVMTQILCIGLLQKNGNAILLRKATQHLSKHEV